MDVKIDATTFKTRLNKMEAKATKANLMNALVVGGRMLQADSMRLVPVDTGTLKRSADTLRSQTSTEPAVDVVYSTDYAIYVHERLDVQHLTPTNAQAKFLEQPARDHRDEYVDAIKKAYLS